MERRELPACDLVMKGGITSGVVYPGTVLDLHAHRRFQNVGGASAGAIAAVVTAAAEYGARENRGGGFHVLERVVADLTTPGFLEGLFQATPETRPLLTVGLRGLKGGRSKLRRTLDVAGAVIGSAKGLLAVAALVGLAGLLAAVLAVREVPLAVALVGVPVVALLVVGAVAAVAGLLLWRGARRIQAALQAHGFGMCPGTRQPGYDSDALTEWLHAAIQDAAGLPRNEPLTFAMLAEEDVRLEVMTTDLSYARPLRLPFDREQYLFRPSDLHPLFPGPVVEAMLAGQDRHGRGSDDHFEFPQQGLPVLVAARMSLSFPILLSAVPLWALHPDAAERVAAGKEPLHVNLFSDGGIASNFPIHFFDAWLPSRPTFGLDLQPAAPEAPLVEMLGTWDRLPRPRRAEIAGIGAFFGQIRDVMQNWRDNMQAALPGYRDRVCAVRLTEEEGGLNLNMDEATIAALVDRGRCAAARIRSDFDWDAHRWTRYLTLMQMLQTNLSDITPTWKEYALATSGPRTAAFARGHEDPWAAAAAAATEALLKATEGWGGPSSAVNFAQGAGIEPEPTPAMRITPRV